MLRLAALPLFAAGLVVTFAVAPTPVFAQDTTTGRISGRVLSALAGEGVPSAQVTVEGTAITALTNWAGRYTLENVPVGEHSVSVRTIGYAAKIVTGVVVNGSQTTFLDISLSAAAVQLEAVTVTADQERGSVSDALNQQRTADQITNAVTAEQIQRSPDSDAGQAVQRVSGVTVEDGRYVFVRGLGERYTTTALNNTRMPSPEPDRKVVPFDLFPSSLLESITTSKTFTADQPGDFSGASVNVKTREFPPHNMFTFSMSGGLTQRPSGVDVRKAPTVGSEWLGFAGDARAIPAAAAPIRTATDMSRTTQAEQNQIIGDFRNAWSAPNGAGQGTGSLGVSAGGRFAAGGVPLGYLGSFTYLVNQDAHLDERRALAVSDADGGTRPQNVYFGSTGTASVLWGGILNFAADWGTSRLALQNTYTRTADNTAARLAGSSEEFNQSFQDTRLSFVERSVLSSQLRGEHHLGDRHTLDWQVSGSGVRRYEPDRSEIVYTAVVDTIERTSAPIQWWGAARSAVRTFSDLHENAYEVSGNYRFGWGAAGRASALKLGVLYRAVERTDQTQAFDITNLTLADTEMKAPPETIFDGTYAANGRLLLNLNSNGGYYTASDRLGAGYTQLELGVSERVRIIAGLRVEDSRLNLETQTAQGVPSNPKPTYLDFLPAAAITFRLSASQNLRFSASQTLSRPEYREISTVPHEANGFGGLIVQGNDSLKRALIQNYDARWEWYPSPAEVVSIALFAKTFEDPIEKVIVATTGAPTLYFVNAKGATNFGVEFEVRRSLNMLASALSPFTLFTNVTLMQSEIEPGNEGISSNTNSHRPMQGQAAYVVNAGLMYISHGGRFSATGLYNVVGRRIVEVGQLPLPDAYELPRHIVDLSAQWNVTSRVAMKLDGKNLLDSPYHVVQGTVTRLQYTTGRVVTFGFTATP